MGNRSRSYRAYEQSQNARTAGIAPAEIRKVEAKIGRLERMRRAIVEEGAVPAN